MDSHGYTDYDEIDMVDHEAFAIRWKPADVKHTYDTTNDYTKVAPAYDGRSSFLAFEDAIDDWCDITELEPEKRGPALRNRLEGDASQYKRLLDRELLRDPNEGVNYFKRFLHPHFIKGAQTVFLHRFMQFMKHKRGTMDLQRWMTRFQLTANRLIESWMDLIPDLDLQAPEVLAAIVQRRTAHEEQQQNLVGIAAATPGAQPHVVVPWTDEMSRQILVQTNNARRQQQRTLFPLSENLSALIFVSLADLTQDQRNTLTSIMTHRGRALAEYNVQELRDLFLEMFCTTRTAVDNPMMQPSGIAQRRSFLVTDEGEIDGTTGYLAEDEDDGAEGFLEALDDVFWVYDDNEYTWHQRRFQGRPTRRGKGKGKRKGKEKAEEAEDSSDQDEKEKERAEGKVSLTWWEKKDMKKNGKKKKIGMTDDGYWAEEQDWNDAYLEHRRTVPQRMSMVCSKDKKRKKQERQERKERKERKRR